MTIAFRQQFWKLEVNLGFIRSHKYNILIKNYLLNNRDGVRDAHSKEMSARARASVSLASIWGLVWHNLYRANFALVTLDDVSLGGDESSILHDLRTLTQGGREIGLHLNVSTVWGGGRWADWLTLRSFQISLRWAQAMPAFLGSPITVGQAMDQTLSARCSDLERAICILPEPSVFPRRSGHFEIFALSTPKLLYTLRWLRHVQTIRS